MGSLLRTTVKYTAPFTTSQATALRTRITSGQIIYRADIEAIRSAMFAIGHQHDITDQVIKYDIGNKDGGTTAVASAKTAVRAATGSLSAVDTRILATDINTMNACCRAWQTHSHPWTDNY